MKSLERHREVTAVGQGGRGQGGAGQSGAGTDQCGGRGDSRGRGWLSPGGTETKQRLIKELNPARIRG